MREIEKLALQCKKTTENLLDFARQSHPREMLPLQMSRILDQAAELVAVYGRQVRVTLSKEYVATKQTVMGNENQLIQVFLNLFNNSIEAIAERRRLDGDLMGHIVVRIRERKNETIVEVSDNGCGIATGDFRRIFSPFYSTKEKRKHAGLGLSISEAILRDHQSRVEVASDLR